MRLSEGFIKSNLGSRWLSGQSWSVLTALLLVMRLLKEQNYCRVAMSDACADSSWAVFEP